MSNKRSQTESGLARELAEREKELDAVYRFARLFSGPLIEERPLLTRCAKILRESMRSPESVGVSIVHGEQKVDVGDEGPVIDSHRADRKYDDARTLTVELRYRDSDGDERRRTPQLEPRERELIESCASLLANALQRVEVNRELRQSSEELERKNIALREVLGQIDAERREVVIRWRAQLHTFVEPLLNQLHRSESLGERERQSVSQLRDAVRRLAGDGEEDRVRGFTARLTPREVEICALIRGGMSSKEIARYLSITDSTVERHRNTIRRKLGLSGTPVNLTTWLRGGSHQHV